MITGPPGAGKSSVAGQLATLLEIEGVEFGALETEQLGWGSPWLAHEHVVTLLRTVIDLQRQAGRTTFLIVATAETSDELAGLIDAIGADQVATVLLTAAPAIVADRIDAREPDAWPGKRALIAHARQLAISMRELSPIDIELNTEDRDADEVAIDIRSALRNLGVMT